MDFVVVVGVGSILIIAVLRRIVYQNCELVMHIIC